jgi:hypothetical protein
VLVGEATVEVAAGSRQTATFAVALAQGARIRASVRQSAFSSGEGTSEGDTLVDAGGLESAMVSLQGARDTIYQTTDVQGKLDFGIVAPGTWRVRVMAADIPAYHALDVEQIELVVHPGDKRDVEFRVIPRKRTVKVIGPDAPEVIRVAPQPLKDAAPAPGPAVIDSVGPQGRGGIDAGRTPSRNERRTNRNDSKRDGNAGERQRVVGPNPVEKLVSKSTKQ